MIVYIDMDDVLCDFTGAKNRINSQYPQMGFPQSQFDFYRRLEPLDGAISAVKSLIASSEYDSYILTAPSIHNPMSYTEKRVWIEEKFGFHFVEKLIICSNKGLLKGRYLIDDNLEGHGQNMFEGELIHFGSARFPGWASVLKYLRIDTSIL
ncbi:MAG: hypothetical protein VX185_00370 [Pseudomonadota bacterium]|nr:hypothetical protein [Pseudomonadota bacterium]